MIVEWLGGPEDGKMFEVAEGTQIITIALFMASNPDNGDHTEIFPVTKVRDIKVEKHANGKYFVRYPME